MMYTEKCNKCDYMVSPPIEIEEDHPCNRCEDNSEFTYGGKKEKLTAVITTVDFKQLGYDLGYKGLSQSKALDELLKITTDITDRNFDQFVKRWQDGYNNSTKDSGDYAVFYTTAKQHLDAFGTKSLIDDLVYIYKRYSKIRKIKIDQRFLKQQLAIYTESNAKLWKEETIDSIDTYLDEEAIKESDITKEPCVVCSPEFQSEDCKYCIDVEK